jgi:hypothetical protein
MKGGAFRGGSAGCMAFQGRGHQDVVGLQSATGQLPMSGPGVDRVRHELTGDKASPQTHDDYRGRNTECQANTGRGLT